MKKLVCWMVLCCVVLAGGAYARPVIADLSLRKIEIDSKFTGTEILLFGARNDAGDIVVMVKGPEISYIARKKERVFGVWVNNKSATFNHAQGFYSVASSRSLEEIKNEGLLEFLEIGVDNIGFDVSRNFSGDGGFTDAFLTDMQDKGLYSNVIEDVSFIGDTLFRTILKFPENIPRGIYTAEVYLFSDGKLSGVQSTPFLVSKKGFDAFLFDFAHNYPALYGAVAVACALLAGWLAGLVFRKV